MSLGAWPRSDLATIRNLFEETRPRVTLHRHGLGGDNMGSGREDAAATVARTEMRDQGWRGS